jgi:hypothetical protein
MPAPGAPYFAYFAFLAPGGGAHVDYVTLAKQAEARIRAERYRTALRWFWRLTAAGAEADRVAAGVAYNEVVRLFDEVGEPVATMLRHRLEGEWHAETGSCPRCGARGERHP